MEKDMNKTDSLTANDLDKIGGLLDNSLAPLATKDFVKEEIRGSENRLKSYINEGVETIMEGIDNISKQLAEKERVDKLEKWPREVSEKVGIRLEI